MTNHNQRRKIILNRNKVTALLVFAALLVVSATVRAASVADDGAEVRNVVERAFQQLRAGEYDGLYDVLPSTSQRRITRERFARALANARGMYELDKMDVEAVRVSGELAVVDMIIYGRVRRPFEGEGKITTRQYVVREAGRWRIAAGDRAIQQQLFSAHPDFARRFPARAPRVYLKRDGRWVDLGSLANLRGKS